MRCIASPASALRLAAGVVLGLSCALSGVTAQAAAQCQHLVVDPAGDAGYTETTTGASQAPPSDPALDLLTADLAATSKTFTAVVRTAADMRTSLARSGHSVELVFQLGGETQWNLSTTFPAVGPVDARLGVVQQGASAAHADAMLSSDGRTLTISVPPERFSELANVHVRQGSAVNNLAVYSNRAVAAYNSGVYTPGAADTAKASRTYRVGQRSCASPV